MMTAAYLAIAGLMALLLYPAAGWLATSWLSNPYYSHGFVIPAVSALLAWRRWPRLRAEPRQGGSLVGLGVTAASLAAIVWAMRWQGYAAVWLAATALVGGIVLYLEGWPRLRHWLFPLLFLGLMTPLPAVDRLSPWLESLTARWATGLARLAGIAAAQQGGEIALPGATVVVGAPCSGLRSLLALVSAGLVWIYLVEGRPAAKALMAAAIAPLAIAANVARIALLLAIAEVWGAEAALTYYHDWSGVVLFLAALGALLAWGRVLGCRRLRDDVL